MKNLFKLRTERKMNQLSVAMKIGVDQVTVSAYESGKAFPSVATLMKLCDAFNVSSDFLLDRTNVRTPVDEFVINNFTASELEMLNVYRKLPFSKQNQTIGFMLGLLDQKGE